MHREDPTGARADIGLSAVLYDAEWRHLATRDWPDPAADAVDLYLDPFAAAGARRVVVVASGDDPAALDRLAFGLAGPAIGPEAPALPAPPAALPRLDRHAPAALAVPLTIDLETRRLRWIDIHVRGHRALQRAGGYRPALAHLGRDFEHLLAAGARPTLWEVACVHATARANVVYVRGPDGVTTYRRRDGESPAGRFARLLAGEHDGALTAIPAADAPTWVALLRDDLAIPDGSAGYILDARRPGEPLARALATDLVAELAPPSAGPG